ncbi:YafY family protein [Prevotella sp. MA2016]|uniref:helix-turn-helix transcriptional regulator n=1 Tax=Prevotella sp. MA2016 TaxID=1408310 RepID=UPI0006881710|nr:WYL domain-containing protein [Prevotella sp. MA2016]
MKPAQIFNQYIWIINTLRAYKQLTFEELARKWRNDEVADGNPLVRSSFNRHRDAIADMFGIDIRCTPKTYKYYIENPETLGNDSLERWLFSSLAVHGVLSDSVSIKDRVVLESVPAGVEHLGTIIQAIKSGKKILIRYQRFGGEAYDKVVAPYAIKLFCQRWYLLSFTGRHYANYALDRMQSVKLTDENFELPEGFSPQDYFSEYYGVMTTDEPLTHMVVRAHSWAPNYLRTLPLHHSQRELRSGKLPSGSEYTDFSFDIRPTIDFLSQLLSHGDGIEVLEPKEVRQQMLKMIDDTRNRY